MAEYITLGFNILCIVLIVFGMLWGLIRGLNKTVSRLVFLLITGIILIFLTIPITNALLNIKISTKFIETEGEIVRKVPIIEFLTIAMEAFVGEEFAANYPGFTELIVSLPLTVIYVVVFLVLFWLLKYALIPVNALINKLIFGKRRRKKNSNRFL